MSVKFYELLVGVLCVWRITHLLNAEDGPWALLAKLRRAVGNGFWGGLMDCFYCLSLWVSAPFTFLFEKGWKERGLLWLAFSAGAILLERLTSNEHKPATRFYFEDQEQADVLQQATTAISGTRRPE